ncbi:MAG: hypothetical protein IPM16_09550 [Chloroflexi bacterium]|nr:hypothetical protein [Chloroflexota bacterium]
MRLSPTAVVAAAIVIGAALLFAAVMLIAPPQPLLLSAAFDDAILTPNADGEGDVTNFRFALSRAARVTLTLDDDGTRYVIRDDRPAAAGEYALAFSGVVAGYVLPDEDVEGDVERRVVPDGDYTWTFAVVDPESGERAEQTGTLSVQGAESDLPRLTGFTISPTVFTPNQDGVADRVAINAYLHKPAEVTGYLIGPDGAEAYLSPRQTEIEPGDAGWQQFDYEGGVDIGADPPPDGEYVVVIEAQDAVGQRVSVRGNLSIADGGKPRAGILGQASGADVVFLAQPYDDAYFSDNAGFGERIPAPDDPTANRLGQVVVPVGDMLVFLLYVENYGSSAIRTDGPEPGTVYQQSQVAAALGGIEQDGVWRVGIQCETSEESYPYRWAVGAFDQLTRVEDEATDNVYYYLEPGQRSVVWGAVRLTDIVRTTNPQQCWAGLIHEGVAVANNRIGARDILIADPNAD